MDKLQKRGYEAPVFQIDTMLLDTVLCTSGVTAAWYEDKETYDYGQLD